MFYGHFTPIFQTAYEPCLKHIIYQTIINLDIRIYYVVVQITDYSFSQTELIFFLFWEFRYPVSRSGESDMCCTPSFFIHAQNNLIEDCFQQMSDTCISFSLCFSYSFIYYVSFFFINHIVYLYVCWNMHQ
jgi:hypothetical protein